jgi:putative membrane protein
MTRAAIIAAAASALALAACGQGRDDAAAPAAEQNLVPGEPVTNTQTTLVPAAANAIEYVNLASASDLYEIESSRLALDRTEDAEVRQFAEMIIADHERSTQQLRTAAGQSQPPLIVSPTLSQDQQRSLETLRGAGRGADFDREYLMQQVSAHERALGMALGYAETGENEAMREHARNSAGPMQQHLQRARQLAETRLPQDR